MSQRRSCRCVPSAQSKSIRSPPRRTRVAAGARCAVGVAPDVPRKTTSRSTAVDCKAALTSLTRGADICAVRSQRPRSRLRALARFAPYVLGSAVLLTVGALVLSSRLPHVPRTRHAAHAGTRHVYLEVFGALWLALILLAGASWLLLTRWGLGARAKKELLQTTHELEQSLLDTIETLNAAVEARDPYTAGHSQRVRRVALAIGRALSLPADRLGALGTAALFHDIGKIGMPDSILTKTEQLTRDESALMREHVTRGAEIVSKFPSFRAAIPALRHHHELWD